MLEYVIFLLGAALMMGAATFLIDSISRISRSLKMSGLLIGATFLALIITFPELVNNIMASLYGVESLGFGNLIGLVLLDNFFFLGLFYIFRKRKIQKVERWHVGYFIISIIVLIMLSYNGIISATDGAILIALFLPYLITLFKKIRRDDVSLFTKENLLNYVFLFTSVFIIVISSVLIVLTSNVIAKRLGIGLAMLGITLIAFFTAFPEYASGFSAFRRGRKEEDIVIGGIYGANMVNLILITGIAALIRPITVTKTLFNSLVFILLGMIFFYAFLHKRELGKEFGVFNFMIYTVYLVLVVLHLI